MSPAAQPPNGGFMIVPIQSDNSRAFLAVMVQQQVKSRTQHRTAPTRVFPSSAETFLMI
jgi:hypothetical protein